MVTRAVTGTSLTFYLMTSVAFYLMISVTLTSCHQLVTNPGALEADDGEAEKTRNVIVQVDGHKVSSTLIEGVHAPRISIQLIFKDTTYIVDLMLNTYLLSQSYVEKIITKDGAIYRHINQSQEMCYYHGTIRNEVHSTAAFSTCEGVKGFFVLNNSTFYITPLQLDASTLVGLYEIKKANNDHLSQWICGIANLKDKFINTTKHQRVKRQIITDSLDGKNVVELYVANDNRRLKFFNGDFNALSRSTREIVNAANLLYQPVGFFIVLVGAEHWQTDQIDVATDSSKTLSNWQSYRTKYILNNNYNDVGFLISRQSFDASVLGLANVGTMCSSRSSGGIMTAILDKSAVSGAILAHEIGHNFGLSHDASDCYCESPDVSCIMSARASTDKPSMYFSACSKSQLRTSVDRGFDICLKDFPLNQNEHYPVCGNGILEQGEDCDCGRMPLEQCNPSCCNPSTCKLVGSAQCAGGACCEVNSCQLKQANTQCRTALGPCDLPETCDGSSAFCPKDIYKHDGMSCSVDGVDAYCWTGMCRTHRSQCKELYGSTVSDSNSMCYRMYNMGGNVNGWCSIRISDQISYTGCQQEDVMCGALQCSSNAATLLRYTNFVMQTNKKVGSFECKGSLLDYGSRVENPGMVPNGASCASGKMCISSRCVSAQSKLDENPCPSCVNGVCTNEGRCLCYQGYFGPTCDNTEHSTGLPGTTTSTTTVRVLPETTTTTTTKTILPETPKIETRIPTPVTSTSTSTTTTTTLLPETRSSTTSTTTTTTTTVLPATTTTIIRAFTTPGTSSTTTTTTTILPGLSSTTAISFKDSTVKFTSSRPEPVRSLPVYVYIILPICVGFALLLLLFAIIFCIKKGCLKRIQNKVVPFYPEKNISSGKDFGQENQAYVSDGYNISVISRNNMTIIDKMDRHSWYPQSLDEEDSYCNLNSTNFPTNDSVKAPLAKPPFIPSATPWKINVDRPDIIPPSSPPSIPAQHLKPKPGDSVKIPIKPSLQAPSLKPTSRPPLKSAASASKPPVPLASAKPKAAVKVTSPPPERPKFPPKTTPPNPPTFPSRLKPNRPAPPKPASQSTTPDVVEEANPGVRDLKAKFENGSFV